MISIEIKIANGYNKIAFFYGYLKISTIINKRLLWTTKVPSSLLTHGSKLLGKNNYRSYYSSDDVVFDVGIKPNTLNLSAHIVR
jgi:hypothetical protein